MKKFISSIVYLFLLLFFIGCNSEKKLQPIESTSNPVVITGNILNAKSDKKTISAIIFDIISGKQQTKVGQVYDNGDFRIDFDLYLACDFYISYGGGLFTVIAHPGDSLHIIFDAKTINNSNEFSKTIQFKGEASTLNQNLINLNAKLRKADIPWNKLEKYPVDKFKRTWDSIRVKKENILEQFIKQENPSEELISWSKHDLKIDYINWLARYIYYNPKYFRNNPNSDTKEKMYEFMDYDFKETDLYNSKSIYFSGRYRFYRIGEVMHANGDTAKYVQGFGGFLLQFKEGFKYGSLSKVTLKTIKKNTQSELLKEILIAREFNKALDRKDIDLFEKNIRLINNGIKKSYLREPLINKYVALKKMLENPVMEAGEKMSELDNVETKKLLETIVSEHKGKIIYLDIWATWCGPCRNEMPYSVKLKESINNENLVFAYLCVSSEKNKWKAFLNTNTVMGSHYFANADQSKYLYQKFNMSGVPQYVIIDKNGEIIDKGFHLRPSQDEIKVRLKELLKTE